MFTGIVEELGKVVAIEEQPHNAVHAASHHDAIPRICC